MKTLEFRGGVKIFDPRSAVNIVEASVTYPIHVASRTLNHSGGTKSYHMMMIANSDGKTVVVFRWGKTGQFGEIQVHYCSTVAEAEKLWNTKENEKTRKGYRPASAVVEEVATVSAELPRAVGLAVFNKIGKKAVNHIDPTFDTSRMRDLDEPRIDEEGRLTGRDKPRQADITADLEAQAKEKKLKELEAYKNDEQFGMF